MKLKLDKKTDALYLRLDEAAIVESEQVAPGVIVDFDNKERVVGIEILNVSKRNPGIASAKSRSARETVAEAVREKPTRRYGK